MTTDSSHRTTRRIARIAGALYLVNVIGGIFSLLYVPSITGGHGDPATAATNILAHETLFRAGTAVAALCFAEFLLVALALQRLLGQANRCAGILMVTLAAISVPLSIAPLTHKLDVLTLLGHAGYRQAFDAAQWKALLMLHLESYSSGLLLAQIFWGLWLIPFGYLVWVSRQLPRVFGVLLILGGLGYVADFLGQLLLPGYGGMALAGYVTLPAALGEIGICLWLLVMGARPFVPATVGEVDLPVACK